MSSSYSPDLRLELIGTGDQAGVWGSTTNTNLGTLIENAVAGYTSVSIIASPQALTAYDGAEDEARFAAIALTTTTGANFTVCIPPNSKLYTFYNSTSYVATISNSTVKNGIVLSGGTTVEIPAGKTMSVWSDGTNVAQQSNHLISPTIASPTIATPTITGVSVAPTAATGTNTTQLATTAFVQATLLASVYPVGSIYMNASVTTNPGTLLGFGTWVAFGAGRVAVGLNPSDVLFDTLEETGGSYSTPVVAHTHSFSATTGTESASHTHTISISDPGHAHVTYSGYGSGASYYPTSEADGNYPYYSYSTASSQTGISASSGTQSANHTHTVSGTTGSAGTTGVNANLQPYIVVAMWKRTA